MPGVGVPGVLMDDANRRAMARVIGQEFRQALLFAVVIQQVSDPMKVRTIRVSHARHKCADGRWFQGEWLKRPQALSS